MAKPCNEYFIMREKSSAEAVEPRLALNAIRENRLYTLALPDGNKAILIKRADGLKAYFGVCPHMGGDLSNAKYDAGQCTLSCCWHGYVYDAASGAFKRNPNVAHMQVLRTPSEHFDPERDVSFRLRPLKVVTDGNWVTVDYEA